MLLKFLDGPWTQQRPLQRQPSNAQKLLGDALQLVVHPGDVVDVLRGLQGTTGCDAARLMMCKYRQVYYGILFVHACGEKRKTRDRNNALLTEPCTHVQNILRPIRTVSLPPSKKLFSLFIGINISG